MKHKTAADYEMDIRSLHKELPNDAIEKKISHRVKRWIELNPLRIQVANNENHPWTAGMLGFDTEEMPTRKNSGFYSVGDYHGVISTSAGDRYIDIVIERKSVEDLYGTLIPEDNRTRFYREIERFEADERFNKMVIIVEGTYTDFLLYQPEFNAGNFDFERRFDTKKNTTINEKKITILADMEVVGISVMFCDNPTLAAQMCGRVFRESVKKEYHKILGL